MLNRREMIKAAGASILLNAGLITAFVKALPAAEPQHEQFDGIEHHNYGYDNPHTGICCYGYNDKGMSIHFKSTPKQYWYSKEVFGEENIAELIRRAEAGEGLNSYINYLRKWPRPKK